MEAHEHHYTHTDAISYKLLDYYYNNSKLIEAWRTSYMKLHDQKAAKTMGPGEYTGAPACDALDRALAGILTTFPLERIKAKNIYYWLPISRRRACLWLKSQFGDPASAALAKIYINNILYAHANPNIDPMEPFRFADFFSYTMDDFKLMYELEVLGRSIQRVATLKRICAKGGILQVSDKSFELAEQPKLMNALSKFDRDGRRAHGILHLFGLLNSSDDPNIDPTKLDSLIVEIIPNAFFKKYETPACTYKDPNTWPQFHAVAPIYERTQHLDPSFEKQLGISFDVWLRCLSFISRHLFRGHEVDTVDVLYRTGFALEDRDYIIESAVAAKVCTADQMELFLTHATFNDKTPRPKALDLDANFFLSTLPGGRILIDGKFTLRYFKGTVAQIYSSQRANKEDKIDNIRGKLLEVQVQEFFDKLKPSKKFKVAFHVGRKFILNGKQIAEADVSIEMDGTLVLIDCKSVLKEPEVDEGDAKTIVNRAWKLRNLLDYRDSQAQKLAENPKGDNYEITQKTICAHLMTADIEWVPLDDSLLWWNSKVPRITSGEHFSKIWPAFQRVDFADSRFVFHRR